MITLLRVYDPLLLGYVSLDDFPYPVSGFSWEYPIVGDDVQRPFAAGRYNSRKSADAMTITCEGNIVENTTTAYWTSRKALVSKVIPDYAQGPTTYRHSHLRMQIDGDTDTYYADVQLSSYAVPLSTTGAPTVSPFQFNWTCNLGYWSSLTYGTPAKL
jgi:hypothetical protein